MRIHATLILALMGLLCAWAVRADDWATRAGQCRTIGDDASRLACYDALWVGVDAQTAAAAAAVAPMTAEQRFGLPPATVLKAEAKRGNSPDDLPTLALKVTSLSLGLAGRVVIGLENGQVWQQLVPSTEFELLKLGDKVEISRGFMGSFWLEAPGKRGAKVTRVR